VTGDSRMFNSINANGNDEIHSITFGDNGKGKVKGLGKIAISNDLSISNVLLVETLNFNLLSIAQLCDLGFKCIFRVDDVEIISVDGYNLIFKGLDMRIYTWLISMLVKPNCQYVCSPNLAWVDYGLVILE
jgi:hypothetical protein